MDEEKTKLNLGSGTDYREGWLNVDLGDRDYVGEKIKIDLAHNLNHYPYPFGDGKFDEIIVYDLLERIRDIDRFLLEINRILKIGGTCEIKVAYFSYWGTYAEFHTEPLHRFCLRHAQLFLALKKSGFSLVYKEVRNTNKYLRIFCDTFINLSEFTQRVYERFFSGIFPVSHIVWKIQKEVNVS